MLWVDFYFPCNLFYFRSSTIMVESPSTTEFNNFFSLFCTTSSRSLSVLDYGDFRNVSKNCRCCVVGFRSLKSSHGNSRVKYFKGFEMNKKINFSMNYYLNISLIGSSTKNDRCQDVTLTKFCLDRQTPSKIIVSTARNHVRMYIRTAQQTGRQTEFFFSIIKRREFFFQSCDYNSFSLYILIILNNMALRELVRIINAWSPP